VRGTFARMAIETAQREKERIKNNTKQKKTKKN
jgi:hypothetical protein